MREILMVIALLVLLYLQIDITIRYKGLKKQAQAIEKRIDKLYRISRMMGEHPDGEPSCRTVKEVDYPFIHAYTYFYVKGEEYKVEGLELLCPTIHDWNPGRGTLEVSSLVRDKGYIQEYLVEYESGKFASLGRRRPNPEEPHFTFEIDDSELVELHRNVNVGYGYDIYG